MQDATSDLPRMPTSQALRRIRARGRAEAAKSPGPVSRAKTTTC
jgi:hypothetical protein